MKKISLNKKLSVVLLAIFCFYSGGSLKKLYSGIKVNIYYLSLYIKQPEITLVGKVKMADGLGRILVELADVLNEHVRINIISYVNDLTDVPKRLHKLIKYQNQNVFGKKVVYLDPL